MGIHISNGFDISLSESTFDGQKVNMHIGRTTSIFPTGELDVHNNKFLNATNQAVLVESFGGSLSLKDNIMRNMGLRAFQSTGGVLVGSTFDITGNKFYGNNVASEGGRITNFGANLLGSTYFNNKSYDFTGKGHNIQLHSSMMEYNKSISCGTLSTYAGTGSVITSGTNQEF